MCEWTLGLFHPSAHPPIPPSNPTSNPPSNHKCTPHCNPMPRTCHPSPHSKKRGGSKGHYWFRCPAGVEPSSPLNPHLTKTGFRWDGMEGWWGPNIVIFFLVDSGRKEEEEEEEEEKSYRFSNPSVSLSSLKRARGEYIRKKKSSKNE